MPATRPSKRTDFLVFAISIPRLKITQQSRLPWQRVEHSVTDNQLQPILSVVSRRLINHHTHTLCKRHTHLRITPQMPVHNLILVDMKKLNTVRVHARHFTSPLTVTSTPVNVRSHVRPPNPNRQVPMNIQPMLRVPLMPDRIRCRIHTDPAIRQQLQRIMRKSHKQRMDIRVDRQRH
nr:MAG TPA: hypothetical protein [Caudoviricetes sp.]